ncbi:hypothetical protein H6F56_15245 [Microcoleus sp. FACHB-672]|nr:hypothetical protein [Microcoleus sp. FACHB-672]
MLFALLSDNVGVRFSLAGSKTVFKHASYRVLSCNLMLDSRIVRAVAGDYR